MNTTVKSLQDVYVELGGELTDTYEEIANGVPVSDYTTNPDVIEAIAQIAGKSLELPKTTSADAGKLLVVNEDGDWDKGDAPEELPEVTASDDGTLLGVVNGAWAKGLKIKSGEAKVTVPSEGTNMTLDFELWKGYGDAIEKKILIGCTLIYTDANLLTQNTPTSYTQYVKNSFGQNSQNVRVSGLDSTEAFTNGHEYTLKYYYIDLT